MATLGKWGSGFVGNRYGTYKLCEQLYCGYYNRCRDCDSGFLGSSSKECVSFKANTSKKYSNFVAVVFTGIKTLGLPRTTFSIL